MQRKHVQPLRSGYIQPSKEIAIETLKDLCNTSTDTTPKDGEVVNARYFIFGEDETTEIRSIMGIFNVNMDNQLEVTIIDNMDDTQKGGDLYWEDI